MMGCLLATGVNLNSEYRSWIDTTLTEAWRDLTSLGSSSGSSEDLSLAGSPSANPREEKRQSPVANNDQGKVSVAIREKEDEPSREAQQVELPSEQIANAGISEVLSAEVAQDLIVKNDQVTDSTALPNQHFQIAWIPFHSERSAMGFADKLESQVQQSFRVVRSGPGKYEVGFDYSSDMQREEVLQMITQVTGYSPQTRGG